MEKELPLAQKEILEAYDHKRDLYADFTKKAWTLVRELLERKSIRTHAVTRRLKTRASLEEKIRRESKKYERLDDITDIAGVRIITYFYDEMKAVADLIEKEFEIDQERSVVKTELSEPDRFGYVSLKYVCSLRQERLHLPKYRGFASYKVEIQIRSILQHAWAEIEHDRGYKTEQEVPHAIRRRFARLAALLEIGDTEFVSIRDSLQDYKARLAKDVETAPATVRLDLESLRTYVKNSKLVGKIDHRLAKVFSDKTKVWFIDPDYLIPLLEYVGLGNLAEVDRALRDHKSQIVRVEEALHKRFRISVPRGRFPVVYAGTCLLRLCELLVARRKSIQDMLELRKKVPGTHVDENEYAEFLISIYDEVSGNTQERQP